MSRVVAACAALVMGAGLWMARPTAVLAAAQCNNTSTGLAALTDLGAGSYQGEQGGLYPGGSNVPSGAYRAAGLQAAAAIAPLDQGGQPSTAGKIVFLSIGMSNTNFEFAYFMNVEASDAARNPAVVMVNGAQSGEDASNWTSSADATWSVVEQRLAAAGVSDQQVQAIWLKQADVISQSLAFETYARGLTQQLTTITSIASQRYPNLRQVFVSARTYGGYSGINTVGGGPNPEPWAYQTAFADKWFVAQSVSNPSQRPWIGWGPYFWTDGTRGRSDGLQWLCSDTADGTHPSSTGMAKVNAYMHSLFAGSVFTSWFTGSSPPPAPSPVPTPAPSPTTTPVSTPAPSVAPSPGASPPTQVPGGVHPSQRPTTAPTSRPTSLPSFKPAGFPVFASLPPQLIVAVPAAARAVGGRAPLMIALGLGLIALVVIAIAARMRRRKRLLRMRPSANLGTNGHSPHGEAVIQPAPTSEAVASGEKPAGSRSTPED